MHIALPAAAFAASLLAAPGLAQILPGHSIAVVTVTSLPGEIYDIDHSAGTATLLTISPTLASENPNSVLMTSVVTGFVGTNPPAAVSATANIYGITVAGGTVTEVLMNTTPTAGNNVAQLTVVGNDLYFCTQTGTVIGTLQSIPVTGGPVTSRLDLASIGATGLANACTSIGTKVYVATFNSSPTASATSPGELFEYDTVTNTGRLVLNLPPGGFQPAAAPWNTGIVNALPDPLVPGNVMLQGVYGDLLSIDPVAGTVTSQVWTGRYNSGNTSIASSTCNSFAWDPIAQDWIVGSRAGTIEVWVHDQQARQKITGVGSSATATQNSVGGIFHMPNSLGSDVSYGPGCQGNDTYTPTDSSFGAPAAGNSTFRFGLFSTAVGDPVILAMGFQNAVFGTLPLPLDGTAFGAPGCFLRTDSVATRFAITSGTGPGGGTVSLPLAIPSNLQGATLYRQWLVLQSTPTNSLGIVVSNARQLTVQ